MSAVTFVRLGVSEGTTFEMSRTRQPGSQVKPGRCVSEVRLTRSRRNIATERSLGSATKTGKPLPPFRPEFCDHASIGTASATPDWNRHEGWRGWTRGTWAPAITIRAWYQPTTPDAATGPP